MAEPQGGAINVKAEPMSRLRDDRFVLLIIIVFATLYSLGALSSAYLPYEDAAMLMRYSQNLARTNDIVWNIGESPVDGATDFLFMILVAGFIKSGGGAEFGARCLGLLSHLLSVIVIYSMIRKFYPKSQFAAAISAGYMVVGPGVEYVRLCFGTTFFALMTSVTWFVTLTLGTGSSTPWTPIAFACSTVMLGLARPEGVLFGFSMFLGLLLFAPRRLSNPKAVLLWYVIVNLVVGGGYLLWRWDYFGHLLPNPFYVKGGPHLSGLVASLKGGIKLSAPFIPFLVLAFRSKSLARECLLGLVPVGLFLLAWGLISDEMNYLARFQYPILPIVLTTWPIALKEIRRDFRLPAMAELSPGTRRALIAAVVVVIVGAAGVLTRQYYSRWNARDGRFDVAVGLAKYDGKRYTIATSEAGLLPFYSRWNAIDVYGLNDAWIAKNGGVTPAYLDSKRPEVIMFPMTDRGPSDHFFRVQRTIKAYVSTRDYVLAAAFGDSPDYLHCYFVRRDFADSDDIVRLIQQTDYHMLGGPRRARNFGAFD